MDPITKAYHHHKTRIAPEKSSARDNYVRRLGKYSGKGDLVSSGAANLPVGIGTAREFFQELRNNERKNGGVYEHEVSLPNCLSREQQSALGEIVARAIAGPSPVIWGVHCPVASSGTVQPHVHALVYPKIPDGIPRDGPGRIFRRHNSTDPARGGWKKNCGGETRQEVVERLKQERATGCAAINDFMQLHGFEHRVDHRSYAEQDTGKQVKRVPGKHLGPYRCLKLRNPDTASPPV